MANHLRRQIREAVATAISGLATTGARVFPSRVYPLETEGDLPGLLVFTLAEASSRSTLPAPGLMQRTVRLQVVAVAEATADLDDALDQICKEVEIALAMPCAALSKTEPSTFWQPTTPPMPPTKRKARWTTPCAALPALTLP